MSSLDNLNEEKNFVEFRRKVRAATEPLRERPVAALLAQDGGANAAVGVR